MAENSVPDSNDTVNDFMDGTHSVWLIITTKLASNTKIPNTKSIKYRSVSLFSLTHYNEVKILFRYRDLKITKRKLGFRPYFLGIYTSL